MVSKKTRKIHKQWKTCVVKFIETPEDYTNATDFLQGEAILQIKELYCEFIIQITTMRIRILNKKFRVVQSIYLDDLGSLESRSEIFHTDSNRDYVLCIMDDGDALILRLDRTCSPVSCFLHITNQKILLGCLEKTKKNYKTTLWLTFATGELKVFYLTQRKKIIAVSSWSNFLDLPFSIPSSDTIHTSTFDEKTLIIDSPRILDIRIDSSYQRTYLVALFSNGTVHIYILNEGLINHPNFRKDHVHILHDENRKFKQNIIFRPRIITIPVYDHISKKISNQVGMILTGQHPIWLLWINKYLCTFPMLSEGTIVACAPYFINIGSLNFYLQSNFFYLRLITLPLNHIAQHTFKGRGFFSNKIMLDSKPTTSLPISPRLVCFHRLSGICCLFLSDYDKTEIFKHQMILDYVKNTSLTWKTFGAKTKTKKDKIFLHTMSPVKLICKFTLLGSESVTCAKEVKLSTSSFESSRTYVAVGTLQVFTEDLRCFGRILLIDLVEPYQTCVVVVNKQERGITAIADFDGFLAIASRKVDISTNLIKILKWNGCELQQLGCLNLVRSPSCIQCLLALSSNSGLNLTKYCQEENLIAVCDVTSGITFATFRR
jgi:hypothetical protein